MWAGAGSGYYRWAGSDGDRRTRMSKSCRSGPPACVAGPMTCTLEAVGGQRLEAVAAVAWHGAVICGTCRYRVAKASLAARTTVEVHMHAANECSAAAGERLCGSSRGCG